MSNLRHTYSIHWQGVFLREIEMGNISKVTFRLHWWLLRLKNEKKNTHDTFMDAGDRNHCIPYPPPSLSLSLSNDIRLCSGFWLVRTLLVQTVVGHTLHTYTPRTDRTPRYACIVSDISYKEAYRSQFLKWHYETVPFHKPACGTQFSITFQTRVGPNGQEPSDTANTAAISSA